jgi:hypothetical protein
MFFCSYDKYGSLGRKESMGRYRKYQAANTSSAVGLSMGSPRLVARNISFQVAKHNFDTLESPRYANVQAQVVKQSPVMGRRVVGLPQPTALPPQSPKSHRRQTSEILVNHKQEVVIKARC